MAKNKMNDYVNIAEILKVLGHPIRLKIISELIDSDKTVSQIWRAVGLSQALVSQHLAVLRHNGIIKSVRKGNTVYYSIINPIAIEILKLIQKQN
jgi:ArsR family transcriptional regulator